MRALHINNKRRLGYMASDKKNLSVEKKQNIERRVSGVYIFCYICKVNIQAIGIID
jgi:hypothetical protein